MVYEDLPILTGDFPVVKSPEVSSAVCATLRATTLEEEQFEQPQFFLRHNMFLYFLANILWLNTKTDQSCFPNLIGFLVPKLIICAVVSNVWNFQPSRSNVDKSCLIIDISSIIPILIVVIHQPGYHNPLVDV